MPGMMAGMIVFVLMAATILRVAFRQVMVVKMKKALHKKHCQKSSEHPVRCFIE
jgi:hypothetical protein